MAWGEGEGEGGVGGKDEVAMWLGSGHENLGLEWEELGGGIDRSWV